MSSGNSTSPDGGIESLLPQYLLISPHLSAYRYFLVCTLTVAAWDTLVLSARTWRIIRQKEWTVLKGIYLMLRYLMPIEFIILAVTVFSTGLTRSQCDRFHLFEPITTAIILTLSSLAMAIRVSAIHEHKTSVRAVMGTLLLTQVVVQFACCFFFEPIALPAEQGCITGPRHEFVGIYWLAPTLLYIAGLALAVGRSIESLSETPIGWWQLMNRDGLNLYLTIVVINMINMIYFFAARPSNPDDPLKVIVTTMATVLTTTMTMRIILQVRGSLVRGGVFTASFVPTSGGAPGTSTGFSNGAQARKQGGPGAVVVQGGGPHNIQVRPSQNKNHAQSLESISSVHSDEDEQAAARNGNGNGVKIQDPMTSGEMVQEKSVPIGGAPEEGEGRRREVWEQ